RRVAEVRQDLLALAHDRHVDAELAERGARGGGRVRADGDREVAEAAEGGQRVLRDPELRRRAAPEEVARRGGDDDGVRRERRDLLAERVQAEPAGVRVDDARLVAAAREAGGGVAVFEGEVRL